MMRKKETGDNQRKIEDKLDVDEENRQKEDVE